MKAEAAAPNPSQHEDLQMEQNTGSAATRLEWSETLCDRKRVDYETAVKAVAALGDEWRLATIKEWMPAVDYSTHNPAIDPAQIPDVELGAHWTADPCSWDPESAVWVVNSGDGDVNAYGRLADAFVRAVRVVPAAGQSLHF